MNFEYLVAKRLLRGEKGHSVSTSIVKIAVVGIAMGLCVMVLALFILTGFKRDITGKLSGFTSHITVSGYDWSFDASTESVARPDTIIPYILSLPEVSHCYGYIDRSAIFSHDEEIHGVQLRGVGADFDASFYASYLKEGAIPVYNDTLTSNAILISSSVARYLGVGTGDKIISYFIQEPVRQRAFIVSGIYDTGFKEYDDLMVVCDVRHLRRLNNWSQADGRVSAISVTLHNIHETPTAMKALDEILMELDTPLSLVSFYEEAPQIISWLNLLNMNVWVILILIVAVAGFNMVSGLMILILDKTQLIGVFKALGCTNFSLRKLFLYLSAGLVGKGMLWGNGIALVLSAVQYFGHVIPLDPVSYYMDTVPIFFDWGYFVLLNLGVMAATVLMLILPTALISKMDPIKTIHFD